MNVTAAAMGGNSLDDVQRLTVIANDAASALADECGLAH